MHTISSMATNYHIPEKMVFFFVPSQILLFYVILFFPTSFSSFLILSSLSWTLFLSLSLYLSPFWWTDKAFSKPENSYASSFISQLSFSQHNMIFKIILKFSGNYPLFHAYIQRIPFAAIYAARFQMKMEIILCLYLQHSNCSFSLPLIHLRVEACDVLCMCDEHRNEIWAIIMSGLWQKIQRFCSVWRVQICTRQYWFHWIFVTFVSFLYFFFIALKWNSSHFLKKKYQRLLNRISPKWNAFFGLKVKEWLNLMDISDLNINEFRLMKTETLWNIKNANSSNAGWKTR